MDTKKTRRRSWVTIIIMVAITILFLIFFDIGEVIDAIRNADWGYLLIAVAILLVGYLVLATRLRYLLRNIPSYKYSFHTMNVSNMVNLVTFIPVTAIRIYLMGDNEKLTLPQASSGISIGLVVDFVMKIVAVLAAILLGIRASDADNIFLISVLIVVGIIAIILVMVAKADKIAVKVAPWLARLPVISEEQSQKITSDLVEGLKGAGSPGRLLVVLLISFVGWIFGLGFYYAGLLTMSIDLPIETALLAVVVATIFVNPAAPYLPPTYILLLTVPMALVTEVEVEELVAFAIVLYAVLLVIWFGFGSLGLRALKFNFGDLRKDIEASIQQMRDSKHDENPEQERV